MTTVKVWQPTETTLELANVSKAREVVRAIVLGQRAQRNLYRADEYASRTYRETLTEYGAVDTQWRAALDYRSCNGAIEWHTDDVGKYSYFLVLRNRHYLVVGNCPVEHSQPVGSIIQLKPNNKHALRKKQYNNRKRYELSLWVAADFESDTELEYQEVVERFADALRSETGITDVKVHG